MKEPNDFIGKKIKEDLKGTPFKIITKETEGRVVYCSRFRPETLGSPEHGRFHNAGAAAYELYLICRDRVIEETNQRIEQLQCSHHSHAPQAAPAWIFPEGAMFDVEWEKIVLSCRKRMIKTINEVLEK